MSDDGSPVMEEQKKKRGRPAKNADKTPEKVKESPVVKEPKKRGRQSVDKNNSMSRPPKSDDEEAATPVKRGRGRPKGTHKKKGGQKAPGATGRGRGRPPKKVEEKPESAGEEEDEQDEDEEEDEN